MTLERLRMHADEGIGRFSVAHIRGEAGRSSGFRHCAGRKPGPYPQFAYFIGQSRGVAMTPNGEVWFRPDDYKADFSVKALDTAWLVHELTHAWQLQTGRSTRVRGLLEQGSRLFGRDPYKYGDLDPARPFSSYSNEQQASIVEDYFRLTQRIAPLSGSGNVAAYRTVIPFLPKPRVRRKP